MLSTILNEQQILRCFIKDPKLLLIPKRNYFVSKIAKDIYDVLKTLSEKINIVIELTPTNIISEGNKINELINEYNIEKLFEVDYDINNFEYYLQRLREDFASYNIENNILKNVLKEVSTRGKLNVEKIESFITDIEENLSYVKQENKLLYTISDMYDDYFSIIIKRQKGEWFYSSGDSYLDQSLFMGFAPGTISTLFASTGIGKSVYALNLINRQINRQIPILYISLEMDLISTMDRLIALRNRIPISIFYPKSLQDDSERAFKILEEERQKFKKIKRFYFVEEPSLSLSDVEYLIKETKKKLHVNYLSVTVDLLTMVKDFNKGGDKQSTIYENNMNRLHEMAKSLNVHFLGVVQANRQADNTPVNSIENLDKLKPSLNTIKNSGAIGERSRIVMSAFRAKYYAERFFPDNDETNIMEDILEIDILKQNMGKLDHLKYLYIGDTANVFKYVEN